MKAAPASLQAKRVGLARALSKLGYCSRSKAAELIRAGRVRLNGAVRRNPETPVRVAQDRIEVDSQLISREKKIYLMLNKPRGLVTTASDDQGRDTIYSCLKDDLPWLSPIGRLDRA
ncbi:MAG: S4 domain-containing protein, partial [Candidatus Angelobacter sp.]